MMQTREAHDFWGLHKNKNCAFHNKLPLRHSQNFDFLNLKICHRVSFWGAQLTQVSLNLKISYCNLKTKDLGAKLCGAFLLF